MYGKLDLDYSMTLWILEKFDVNPKWKHNRQRYRTKRLILKAEFKISRPFLCVAVELDAAQDDCRAERVKTGRIVSRTALPKELKSIAKKAGS